MKPPVTLTDNTCEVLGRIDVRVVDAEDQEILEVHDGEVVELFDGWLEDVEPEFSVLDAWSLHDRHGWAGVLDGALERQRQFHALPPRKRNPAVGRFYELLVAGLAQIIANAPRLKPKRCDNKHPKMGREEFLRRLHADEFKAEKDPDGTHWVLVKDPRRGECDEHRQKAKERRSNKKWNSRRPDRKTYG